MYGVESAVHPDYRGRGIGSKLMDARFDVLRQLNLRGMVAGSAIIDYHTASHLTPDEYVREVVAGQRFDTNLSKQLHKGFRVHNIIPNYLEDEEEGTLGYGVAIVWYNPDYRPNASVMQRVRPRQYDFQLRPLRT
jgi:ribosomal protein S18 acetylase RimI-like enzyme